MIALGPNLVVSACAAPAQMTVVPAVARKVTPARSADQPSTCWTESVNRKEFAKTIHSQPRYLTRIPPNRTPAAAPEPPSAPQIPSALLRSAPSVNVVVTIDSAAGEMIAAPSPWIARAAIRIPALPAVFERPQAR